MRTIAIDSRFASTLSGLGRYTRELTIHLLKRDDPVRFVLFVSPQGRAWASTLPHPERWSLSELDVPPYSLREHLLLPRALRQSKADLLFVPHFNVPFATPTPVVATIHDLILHRFPNAAPWWKRAGYRFLMRRTVRRARALIAVSGFVRDELQRTYGSGIVERSTVISEGVGPQFSRRRAAEQDRVCGTLGIHRPFFLYVGNAKQHKNVPLLLEAFGALGEGGPSLVLVSSGRETEHLSLPPHCILLTRVDDAQLPALYSAASAFVTASLYEGFCLPVVEALACGCPVIAVREGPLEEISQGNALLVEPSVSAFTAALRTPPPAPIAFAPPSWETAAAQTVHVLLGALE